MDFADRCVSTTLSDPPHAHRITRISIDTDLLVVPRRTFAGGILMGGHAEKPDKIDGRQLSEQAMYERRRLVVRLHKQGHRRSHISRATALSYSAVTKIITLFTQGGMQALRLQRRGRRAGTQRLITEEQAAMMQEVLQKEQGGGGAVPVWTRAAVADLIEQHCQVRMSERTLGRYLQRWGLTLKRTRRE